MSLIRVVQEHVLTVLVWLHTHVHKSTNVLVWLHAHVHKSSYVLVWLHAHVHKSWYDYMCMCWYGYIHMYTRVSMAVVTIAAQGTRPPQGCVRAILPS